MACLNTSIISAVPIDLPSGPEQYRIAEILSTLDETIEQTEMVIAKYQQMKAGLMQDLFTRGVTPDGRLRPIRIQAPHLYNESPVGWIPKEWGIERIDRLAESLVDGPFGSNLKTEHYVAEPGVRVVRLQNIEDGNYNDRDRAFVSIRHAEYLARNQVKPGDVLIAGLGEDNNVVGRACCYPDGLPNAINKADCFRLRCRETRTFNAFVMHFLNTSGARQQIRRFEQGVTRRRINTTNLRKVTVGLPTKTEQESIITILSTVAAHLAFCVEARTKLQQQKLGLMHDLLTARVRVKATESEEVLA
jgi:type I restriction enzyme S subunit